MLIPERFTALAIRCDQFWDQSSGAAAWLTAIDGEMLRKTLLLLTRTAQDDAAPSGL